MKINWKRTIKNKIHNFEISYLISAKINQGDLKLPRIYIEKDYLQDALKSVVEECILDSVKRKEEKEKSSELLDEKTRIKNHFRNICFRKKFNTLQGNVKYIADYYTVPEMTVMGYVEEDLPYIKKFSGLK